VRQPLDFSPNYFRPLALSSLLVQIWVWQANPAPFHAANVLIHLVNAALVCALGLRLLGGRWQGLLAGALYGAHPALVESVAFVSSRYDLLATLFLLLALWLEGRLQGAARVAGVADGVPARPAVQGDRAYPAAGDAPVATGGGLSDGC
jgi:hypothetical protein